MSEKHALTGGKLHLFHDMRLPDDTEGESGAEQEKLRQEHPDYCPQAFAELAAALATPNRLQLLLLCTRLPLGVIRETHIVE